MVRYLIENQADRVERFISSLVFLVIIISRKKPLYKRHTRYILHVLDSHYHSREKTIYLYTKYLTIFSTMFTYHLHTIVYALWFIYRELSYPSIIIYVSSTLSKSASQRLLSYLCAIHAISLCMHTHVCIAMLCITYHYRISSMYSLIYSLSLHAC